MAVNATSLTSPRWQMVSMFHTQRGPDMSALKDYPKTQGEAENTQSETSTTSTSADANPPAGLSDAAKAFFLQLQTMGMMASFQIGTDEDDVVVAGANSLIDSQDGNDKITAFENSKIIAGNGDDTVTAWASAYVDSGDGDDIVNVWSDSYVNGGDGDDMIATWSNSHVDGGAGNDRIDIWSNSSANGGDGDDTIVGWSETHVSGENGDDTISVWSDSFVEGGDGDDTISVWSNSTAYGGNGDDVIIAAGHSTISGGKGNDMLSVSPDSTILFDLGDGKDTILAGGAKRTVVKLGAGFSVENTTMTYPTEVEFPDYSVTIAFNDGSDQITIGNLTPTTELTLAFADGNTLPIELPEEHKTQYGEAMRAKFFFATGTPDLATDPEFL